MTATASPLPHAGPPQRTILSVQVLRGLAAVAVALYHTGLILSQPQYGAIEGFGWLSSRGWMGVNFFFVLSGFIILLAHRRDIGHPEAAPRYFWRRFVRVYPVYWVFLTAYILAAATGFGYPDFSWEPLNLLSAYALFGFAGEPALPLKVAWTLFYEVQFYLLFAVLIFSRPAGLALFALWTIAILACSAVALAQGFAPLSMWNIYFIVGMATCWSVDRLDPRRGPWLAAAGLVLLVIGALFARDRIGESEGNDLLLLTLAVAFALILLGTVLLERQHRWVPPRWLLLVGDASYSIYLVHSAVISVVAMLNARLGIGTLPASIVFFAAFASSIVAGIVSHLVIERPILAVLRNGWPMRKPQGRSA